MNINLGAKERGLLGGMAPGTGIGLKSAVKKQERQAKRDSQIEFWEKQKAGLREMRCDTAEEIAEKLSLYHAYEDSISAAKHAYNNEQMWHTMDEAREQGEKLAEAAKEREPKTEEERKEELQGKYGSRDEDKGGEGLLEEMMDSLEGVESTMYDTGHGDAEERSAVELAGTEENLLEYAEDNTGNRAALHVDFFA